MPHKDPEKQKAAQRDAMRRKRQGGLIDKVAERVAEAGELPEPPTRDQILRVLGVLALDGHVTAARTLLEEYRRADESPNEEKPLAGLDELAQRRAG